MIIASFTTIPLLLFSLLFAYVSHHICLALAATPPHYLILPISLNNLDLVGFKINESSWLTDFTTPPVAGTGFTMIKTRERCLVLEFFFCFFFDQGIGSRSGAWASRVDVV